MRSLLAPLFFCAFLTLMSLHSSAKSLWIGDSHSVGACGAELSRVAPQPVTRVAAVGATATTFSSTSVGSRTVKLGATISNRPLPNVPSKVPTIIPLVSDLIEEVQPETVFIALGENFYDYRSNGASEGKITSQVNSLLRLLPAQQKCVWILPTETNQDRSPPYYKSNQVLRRQNQLMARLLSPRCKVITGANERYDASDVKTGGDGLHHTVGSCKRWAQEISRQLSLFESKTPSTSQATPVPSGTR